ncbi:hypothetical protein ACWCP6_13560 [Streptomyces sp. NPDC002004]
MSASQKHGSLDAPTTPGSPEPWDGPPEDPSARHTPGEPQRAARTRRGGADPVKALMHRHRDLCERAVDPLEIAAGLEAHGVTDRTAARYRHRDVFSLAEEMYARAARDDDGGPAPASPPVPAGHTGRLFLALLPATAGAATITALRLTTGPWHGAVAVTGVLGVAATLRTALRTGPLHATRQPPATSAWTCWLVAYALLGDGLLRAAIAGGPDGGWPLAAAPALALTAAVAPATWCARLFAGGAARRLTASRGLEEFAASVRPLLFAVFALFLAALAALLWLSGTVLHQDAGYAGAGALGALLMLARLLTSYGFLRAGALVLGCTGAAELLCLAAVFGGRVPGCGLLSAPVEAAVAAWGPGVLPAAACGTGAVLLLAHAARTLTRASAHAEGGGPR